MKEYTTNGILYTWELAGSAGAAFIIYPEVGHTKKDIAAAKAELRAQHDVVSLHQATPEDWDRLYKGEIFRQPETKPLKWYEIEQDDEVIRRERLKGTTPANFVKDIVLPNIAVTTEKYVKRYGKLLSEL